MNRPILPKPKPRLLLCCALSSILFFTACSKSDLGSSDKDILSFTLKQLNNVGFDTSNISINIGADTIRVTVPEGTNLGYLIPEIAISGVSISPASGTYVNFASPVTFTVTAQDGSTKSYVVIVQLRTLSSTLYVGSSDNNFYALDAISGHLKWQYSSTAPFSYSSPTYHSGVVFTGGIDGKLYAFDAVTGAVKWAFEAAGGIEASSAVSEGVVYVGSDDHNVYAVDEETGTLKWKFSTGGNVGSSPTVVENMVYVGSDDATLYALDKTSGQPLWNYSLGGIPNQSGASVVNGILYIGSRDGYLSAIDVATHQLRWHFYGDGVSLEQSSPTVSDGYVYFSGWYNFPGNSLAGSLYKLDATDGHVVWKTLDNLGFTSSPYIAGGKVYTGCDDLNFYALDATTGAVLWSKRILPNRAGATVANGLVYIGGGGTGYIYAFDQNTGNEKWKFPVPHGLMTSSPCVVTSDGEVCHPSISGEKN